jgi:hypothetical protein
MDSSTVFVEEIKFTLHLYRLHMKAEFAKVVYGMEWEKTFTF